MDSSRIPVSLGRGVSKKGVTVDYLDTCLFPTQLRMSWQSHTQVGCLTLPEGRQIDLQDIHSVFWPISLEFIFPR